MPKAPSTISEIDLSGEWSQTGSGENWIIYNNNTNDGKIVIFATYENLSNLASCKTWYGDGTFNVAPPLFTQLYSIHGTYLGRTVPLVYCLLPKKSKEVYLMAFNAIKSKLLENDLTIEVETFRFDFETASHKAAKEVFPESKVECCFFHFGQANWRHVAGLGFRQRYIEDVDFALKVRMVTALAFMPECSIRDGFQQVSAIMPEEFGEFLEYFAKTYVGRYTVISRPGETMRLGWKDGKFPPSTWSVYERVLSDDPRTNNFLEGWHNRFASIVGVSHPDIYKFIVSLKSEQARCEMIRRAALIGEDISVPRKSSITKNKRIFSIVSTFAERTEGKHFLDYLEGLAHNFTYHI